MQITVKCQRCKWEDTFNGSPLGMMQTAITAAERHYRSERHSAGLGRQNPKAQEIALQAFDDVTKTGFFQNFIKAIWSREKELRGPQPPAPGEALRDLIDAIPDAIDRERAENGQGVMLLLDHLRAAVTNGDIVADEKVTRVLGLPPAVATK